MFLRDRPGAWCYGPARLRREHDDLACDRCACIFHCLVLCPPLLPVCPSACLRFDKRLFQNGPEYNCPPAGICGGESIHRPMADPAKGLLGPQGAFGGPGSAGVLRGRCASAKHYCIIVILKMIWSWDCHLTDGMTYWYRKRDIWEGGHRVPGMSLIAIIRALSMQLCIITFVCCFWMLFRHHLVARCRQG